MRKLFEHILIALALGFLMMIPLWMFVFAPRIVELPDDFSYDADLISEDNFYDQSAGIYVGVTQSNSSFSYTVVESQPGVMMVNNSFNVQLSSGEQILHIDRNYGINPVTRRHVLGFGDHDRLGYLFAPTHLRVGQEFTYWHVSYDVPAEMHYKEIEVLDGLTTYHYQTTLRPDQTKNLSNLPYVGETLGINLDVVLDLWVEPTTGRMIKYSDQAVAYYYDLVNGERLYPWNAFSNTFTEDAVLEQVQYARQNRYVMIIVEQIVPALFFILYILCIVPLLMHWFKIFDHLIRRVGPFFVFGAGLVVTVFLYFFSVNLLHWQKLTAFQHDTQGAVDAITNRVEVYRNILEGGAGLFASVDTASRDQWKAYVSGIRVQSQYAGGLHSMGYAQVVSKDEKTAHEEAVRAQGFPDYAIHPLQEGEVYTSIVAIEPLDERNKQVFGFDMYTDPVRKVAMDLARDSGRTAATGKVALVQKSAEEEALNGFVLYVPNYGDQQVYSVVDRRSALQGYVFGSFRMNDFVDAVFQNQALRFGFTIYDDAIGENSDGFLYTNIDFESDPEVYDSAEAVSRRLFLFGHHWKIVFVQKNDSNYFSKFEALLPPLILLGGVGINLLFGILLYLAENGYLRFRRKSKRLKNL